MNKKRVVIVGGGAAGLMVAMHLDKNIDSLILEKEKSVGRKLLVAGKGGFNLTNQKDKNELYSEYCPKEILKQSLSFFGSKQLRTYLEKIGIPTFIGSSGRAFPEKGIKPVQVLNAFVKQIEEKGFEIRTHSKLVELNNNHLYYTNKKGERIKETFDYCVLALGGASWSKTGSDGKWVNLLNNIKVKTVPFEPSNCGLEIEWNKNILEHHIGKPLKNIQVNIGAKTQKGEALITQYGLEGNAIYPVSSIVREKLKSNSKTQLSIDFKPFNSTEEIKRKLKGSIPKQYPQKIKLPTQAWALIKSYTNKEEYLNTEKISQKIKQLQIPIKGLRPIEEAISTVGGIDTQELNKNFSLKKQANIYTIGEMVNWDAPTGGFLLQGCFSMAIYVAHDINQQ